MIYVSIFACVLALGAVGYAAVASITLTHRMRALELLLSTTRTDCKNYAAELRKTSPASLAVEVAALSDAVNRLRETHRRFAGRFDAHVQHEHTRASNEDGGDDELTAMLQLQGSQGSPT